MFLILYCYLVSLCLFLTRGFVCIIVDVGGDLWKFAPINYPQLVQLHEKYAERGLRILAFPCNQFEQVCTYYDAQLRNTSSLKLQEWETPTSATELNWIYSRNTISSVVIAFKIVQLGNTTCISMGSQFIKKFSNMKSVMLQPTFRLFNLVLML